MAAPITHIYLAQELLNNSTVNIVESDFIVGTSFPDIRYLGVIDREKTHQFNVQELNEVFEENSFISGLKFHCWVDQIREDFIRSENIYDYLPKSKWITQALKFYEDTQCYQLTNKWPVICSFFNLPTDDEIGFGILKKDVKIWHKSLQSYFLKNPSNVSRIEFIQAIGLSSEIADEINILISRISNDQSVIKTIEEIFSYVRNLISEN